MKTLNISKWSVLPLMLLGATFTSCLGDGDETIVLEEEKPVYVPEVIPEGNGTQIVTSTGSAVLNGYGFRLTIPNGAVPSSNSGEDGKIVFSVQQTTDMPASLPAGSEVVPGTNVKFEPMNFVFESPLTIEIPLQGYNANEVTLYRFNDATNAWEPVPFSSVNSNGTASVAVIELGQFVLVKNNGTANNLGGIHISNIYLKRGYYYYVTLSLNNGNANALKKISFTADGKDLYMSNIPLGSYYVTVARQNRTSLSTSAPVECYTGDIDIEVTNRLVNGNGDFSTYTGWTEVQLMLDEAMWNESRPDWAWGESTKTYGTGKFQATLTWVNSEGSIVDYDLHLFGPNSMHVYYGSKTSDNFELDRDWTSPLGNAIENIYSVNDGFVPGEYTVKVHHYSGVTGKRYNCRIIMDGVVVKSVTGAINTTKVYDTIYSFTVN